MSPSRLLGYLYKSQYFLSVVLFHFQSWKIILFLIFLFLLFFARISLGFQFQTMGSVSSQIIDELSFNYTQIGSLIGLFMVPGLFLAIPAGLTGNFLSDKSIIGLGLISLSLGGGIASLSETYELFFSGRLICGVGFVFSTIFFAKVTTDWFEGKELATAMSILVMYTSILHWLGSSFTRTLYLG